MTTLVRNAWYVAAWSTEVDDQLRRFVILGDAVLLFRRQDGRVAALEGGQVAARYLPGLQWEPLRAAPGLS